MNEKIFIGIDFSINSPGMSVLTNNEHSFVSFVNTPKDLSATKIPKSLSIHKELLDNNLCNVITYIRDKKHEIYSIDQSNKIKNAIDLATIIINTIKEYIQKSKNVYIAIEGYSYGSKGNSFIDLIAFNSILREKIVTVIGYKNFHIFSPSEIKKYAGKGNANKIMMMNYWFNNSLNDKTLTSNPLYKWCMDNKEMIIDNKDNIRKPLDDLIDAYFISSFLKYTIEQN